MKPPASVTSMPINFAGLLVSLTAVWLLRENATQLSIRTTGVIVVCMALAIPIVILEWLVLGRQKSPASGIDIARWGAGGPLNWRRCLTKLLGFYAVIAAIVAIYALFPEYRQTSYIRFFFIAEQVLPWWMLAAVPYFFLVDRLMNDPLDGYWHLGRAICMKFNDLDLAKVWQTLLGWFVKAFFLPLMFFYIGSNLNTIIQHDFTHTFDSFKQFFDFSYNFLFYVDLLFVTVGYAFTLRLFDSHIRSTEPSILGWLVALMCYQPFWDLFYRGYLTYDSGPVWGAWLSGYPVLYMLWGTAILALLAIYAWASIAFGVRFSNLTHRGILTNGPFRFCRHPAYLSKNLSWWMISMPFMVESGAGQTIRQVVLLLMVNLIYFFRAKTEERHLAADPDYVAYAIWIDENGLFAAVRRRIPLLRFKGGGLLTDAALPDRHIAY